MMPVLRTLLRDIENTRISGDLDLRIKNIQFDSARVQKGDLFVAVKGCHIDGHRFIPEVIRRGACAVCIQDAACYGPDDSVTWILMPDTRIGLSLLASRFFHQPDKEMYLFGITGTNGKTTTSYLLRSIMEQSGQRVGLIGTIEYLIDGEYAGNGLTTPDPVSLNRLMRDMLEKGVKTCIMEVSSHALAQHRTFGLSFDCAVFTNLSHDHLDYHRSLEEYFLAKAELFSQLAPDAAAVLNCDDGFYPQLLRANSARRTLSYSVKNASADIFAEHLIINASDMRMTVCTPLGRRPLKTKLIGEFNAANILAAVGAGVIRELDVDVILAGVESVSAIRGRLERLDFGQDFLIVLDYAHTPDALERCLTTLRRISDGHIISVFGCGGDRDVEKRPLMGEVASQYSDFCLITTDNPRSEDPQRIIRDIAMGVPPGRRFECEIDRTKAICRALGLAGKGDVVVIAGKGHETYQEVKKKRFFYDDRQVVRKCLTGSSP